MSHFIQRWTGFWFGVEDTRGLDLVRVGVGLCLLMLYGGLGDDLYPLYGQAGWTPSDALFGELGPAFMFSPLHWSGAGMLAGLHFALVTCAALFTLGVGTRWVKWPLLLLHLAFAHRNPTIAYGVDNVVSCLLIVLALAPERGAAWRSGCLRLIQIQMVVFFFFAGVGKLRGDSWWEGVAVWIALTNHEYGNLSLDLFAEHFWLINAMTYGSILLELAYPFLVWGRARQFMVVGAIGLHVGIGVSMGLYAFSVVMIAGHLAFARIPLRWPSLSAAGAADVVRGQRVLR